MDLSGHGHSDWRPDYDYDIWADDIATAAQAYSNLVGRGVVVVAHSLGGIAALQSRVREHHDVRAVVSVDGAPIAGYRPPASISKGVGYTSLQEAVEHFKRARDRATWVPGLVDSVARASVHEVHGSYRWRHDPAAVGKRHPESCGTTATPAAIIRGELSPFYDDIAESSAMQIPGIRLTTMPGVGHDVMMQQPAGFLQTLRAELRALQL
jgi:pimeloyl-ACP methyl ester carboxylesterase